MQPIQPMQPAFYDDGDRRLKSNDPDELWSNGIQNLIMGIGFLTVSMGLLITGVAGGRFWWWAMLIPAFTMLARGISYMSKSKRIANRTFGAGVSLPNQMPNFQSAQNSVAARENLLLIEEMIGGGRKIEAIKIHRETFGSNLREAKEAVERIAEGNQTSNFQSSNRYAEPLKSIYDTGELVPPSSVTENTTRHLEINNEGETMTLPPNNK